MPILKMQILRESKFPIVKIEEKYIFFDDEQISL